MTALTEAVCSKEPWSVLNDIILTVLYDCVSRGSSKTGGTAPQEQQPSSSTASQDLEGDALLAAFQKLYTLFLLSTMTEALVQATPEAASQVLGHLTSPLSNSATATTAAAAGAHTNLSFNLDLNGHADTENGNTDRIIDVTQDLDDELIDTDADNGSYEPLESPVAASETMPTSSFSSIGGGGTAANSDPLVEVISKIQYLSSKLSYHIVSSAAAWQDGILLSTMEQCLTALCRHPHFLELRPAAGAVCNLLHDRCVHSGNPVEFETAMAAVVNGLHLNGKEGVLAGVRKEKENLAALLLGLSTAASLSSRLPQGPSRRKLWTQSDEFWIQLAAGVLEQKEAQWRKQKKKKTTDISDGADEDAVQILVISSLIAEFYILDAPLVVTMDKIQDVLLSTGLFRSLILSFINYGRQVSLEALRRTLLICCSSSTGLSTWAKAVPGFSAAWEYPEFREKGELERYGAVHAAVFGQADGDEALARVLLLDGRRIEAENVPEVYITLKLIESVQKARDRGERRGKEGASFLPGTETVAALERLGSSLRALKAALDDTEGQYDKIAARDESEEAEKAREEEKLALSSEQQAGKLAARRAKLLQPECLRIIKGLRAKPGSVGKSD